MALNKVAEWKQKIKELPRLSSDNFNDKAYFDVFVNNANYVSLLMQWSTVNFTRFVVEKLTGNFSRDEELRLLAVGSGRGTQEAEFLRLLSCDFDHLTCTAVEPSSEGQKIEDILKATEETKDVKFSWVQEKLEDYWRGRHGNTKYHVISAINSLYFVDDLKNVLENLISSVEEGGFVIVVLDSETNGWYKLRRQKPWFSQFHNITTQKVQSVAERAGCNVTAFHLPVRINITDVFDEDSAAGAAILDFMTDIYRCRESVPDDIKTDLLQFLGLPEITAKGNDGGLLLKADQELLLIQK